MENIRDQVDRTEDLIKLHITKLKREQQISIQNTLEHTEGSKNTRNEILAGIGVLLSLFGALLSTRLVDHVAILIWFIFFAIIGLGVYFGSNRRLRKLNRAFGEEIAIYDQRIVPLEEMLEDIILMTINRYEGDFKAIREVATLVSYLTDATQLYIIKPYEKLIQTKTFDREINQSMKNKIKYLKNNATFYYKQYKYLRHERIPNNFRKITERVFKDNEEFIDKIHFAQPA